MTVEPVPVSVIVACVHVSQIRLLPPVLQAAPIREEVEEVDVLVARCAGLDVHKQRVTACVRTPLDGEGRRSEVRTFDTTLAGLTELAGWLMAERVTEVVMESTGSYWKPVWAVLEEVDVELKLVNARHVKQVPGRKTDVNDATWLAQLLEVGLLEGSFVPPPAIRQLRDLTRYQKRLIQDRVRESNRVQKVLEDAVIKLGSVASNVLGVSGRAMIEALISGERDPEVLAELAHGRLRVKIPELVAALDGRFEAHHAVMLRLHLDHIDYLDEKISGLDDQIDEVIRPFEQARELLCTIPGIGTRVANTIIAETGADMTRFPTPEQLVSWAGLCPGNNESAGKRRSTTTRPGNVWLTDALTQAAWAAARSRDNFIKARFWRLARRIGKKKAVIATAHQLLTISWHLLATNTPYQDLGADYYHHTPNPQRRIQHLIAQLEALGQTVTIKPAA
jgi:transposase